MDSPRITPTANVIGIPSIEELNSGVRGVSPPLPLQRPDSPRPTSSRPVSVNHNIYGGSTTPSSKINRLNQSLNANLNNSGLLNSSKVSSNASPSTNGTTKTSFMDSSRDQSHHDLNSTQISPITSRSQRDINTIPRQLNGNHQSRRKHRNRRDNNLNATIKSRLNSSQIAKFMLMSNESGVKEMITSLGLLCVISLLLALLSLVFLLEMSPGKSKNSSELGFDILSESSYVTVYEVTLALCALSLSLNLCCLLVCSIQFIFAIKLVKGARGRSSTNAYLRDAALTRTCAIGGFFISIPIFLTGIILYTYLRFDSTSAIITSILIGLVIVFCGAAIVHNVFIWQKEKSHSRQYGSGGGNNNNALASEVCGPGNEGKSFMGLPQATLDLSGPNGTIISAKGLELSTLV